jgi:hypothetical protein
VQRLYTAASNCRVSVRLSPCTVSPRHSSTLYRFSDPSVNPFTRLFSYPSSLYFVRWFLITQQYYIWLTENVVGRTLRSVDSSPVDSQATSTLTLLFVYFYDKSVAIYAQLINTVNNKKLRTFTTSEAKFSISVDSEAGKRVVSIGRDMEIPPARARTTATTKVQSN